jgi:chromosome segregation ATPase
MSNRDKSHSNSYSKTHSNSHSNSYYNRNNRNRDNTITSSESSSRDRPQRPSRRKTTNKVEDSYSSEDSSPRGMQDKTVMCSPISRVRGKANKVIREWQIAHAELTQRYEELKQSLGGSTPEELKKNISDMHRENQSLQDRIAVLQREKLLLEGRCQQLEEARKDWQERYAELKQDYRELYRNVRSNVGDK